MREVSVMSGCKFEVCLIQMIDGLNLSISLESDSFADFVSNEVLRGLRAVETARSGGTDPEAVANLFLIRTTTELPPTSIGEELYPPDLGEEFHPPENRDDNSWSAVIPENPPGKVHRVSPSRNALKV